MNTTSVLGGGLLLLIGIGFLGCALTGWMRRTSSDGSAPIAVVIDVLVGGVAVADATISVLDQPQRAALWWGGSAVLALSLALLGARHRSGNRPRDERPAVPVAERSW